MKVNPLFPFVFFLCAAIGAVLFIRDVMVEVALFAARSGHL